MDRDDVIDSWETVTVWDHDVSASLSDRLRARRLSGARVTGAPQQHPASADAASGPQEAGHRLVNEWTRVGDDRPPSAPELS